ncbi:hypothetical protein DFH09DRAFT_1373589 [Mycena vulgaris]|nr:hypothetical protein DFH09DRAFT_1373589 [Mycena vulgaris]
MRCLFVNLSLAVTCHDAQPDFYSTIDALRPALLVVLVVILSFFMRRMSLPERNPDARVSLSNRRSSIFLTPSR